MLTYTKPDAAADALSWRNNTLPIAQDHAKELGLAGAAYAWRTIHGEECSGYWPAGTAAFHINADIAEAVVKYCDATQDAEFEREVAPAACWSRPPACGAPSASTTATASSASRASPAPTSTARSRTTTSTPT